MKRNKGLLTVALILIIINICTYNVLAADTENSENDIMITEDFPNDLDSSMYDEDGYLLGHLPEPEEFFSTNSNKQIESTQSISLQNTNLPNKYDLSQEIYFPPVGDQHQMGSCVSWAATYYQFTYQVARLNNWNAKANNTYRFSPKWTYNFCNNGKNIGSTFADTYRILQNTGAARYSEFIPLNSSAPIEYRQWLTATNIYKRALQYRVSDLSIEKYENNNSPTPIVSPDNSGLKKMKEYISSGHILTFSTKWKKPDYDQLSKQYQSSLNGENVIFSFHNKNTENTGHAMAIVGYDDKIWYDLNGNKKEDTFEKGAFKVVNSHSTQYGNNGFIWLMYDALNEKSNASNLNYSNRESFIENYRYYKIEVAECELKLTAEITLNHTHRNEIILNTAPTMLNNNWFYDSFLFNNGGDYGFSGYSGNSTVKFVFDYGNMPDEIERRNIYVIIRDGWRTNPGVITNVPTIINEIKLIDKTGKEVVKDTEEKITNNSFRYFMYKIGMVGDVDNNASVDISDATRINSYLAELISLSPEDKTVSDTDGDVNITIMDVTHLQRYIAGIITKMDNGMYARLN